jgi:hypothetical protein
MGCSIYGLLQSMALIPMLFTAVHRDLVVTLAVPEQDIAVLAHQMVKSKISG